MWLICAFGSAAFAGITAVLAKCGIQNVNSNLATAIRTFVVLFFSWVMVFVVGSQSTICDIDGKSLCFLILSGLATGASWLCYFRALQLADIDQVTPVDKSSTVITILLAFLLLGEQITVGKLVGILAISAGTYLMVQKQTRVHTNTNNRWLAYAILSAVFASLTSILGKVGITGVESNLGTAIRTIVVLVMAWLIVFLTKQQKEIKKIDRKSCLFLILSGITTGASWLCYYRALQDGPASIVVPIDKLSIVLTVTFSYIFLKERLSKKALIGLGLIVAGTLSLLI